MRRRLSGEQKTKTQCGEEGGDLDLEQVRQGRGRSDVESRLRTRRKWINRMKKSDGGREFVRCRLVARILKPRRDGPREDLFATLPPLQAKKALSACVAGVREKR